MGSGGFRVAVLSNGLRLHGGFIELAFQLECLWSGEAAEARVDLLQDIARASRLPADISDWTCRSLLSRSASIPALHFASLPASASIGFASESRARDSASGFMTS